MDTAVILKIVVSTLNNVEVRGKENLDRLLGCIQTLEKEIEALQKNAGEKEVADG
jgi:hypothetical protein